MTSIGFTANKDDVKNSSKVELKAKVIEKTAKSVLKKSEKTKVNYSNKIHVLVTPKHKKEVKKRLKTMNKELDMLAKVIYRESRGSTKTHSAAVAWCILNRVSSPKYGDSIESVITSPNQFAWVPNTPVKKYYRNLAKDVVTRWLLEQKEYKNVGRVLPKDYFFFTGDGKYNYFRKNFNSTTYWNWQLKSPY